MVNLRGDQRTQGERSRREGGKVFGQGSRAPVSITVLVRNSASQHEGCRILYHDIGDYLKREDKLAILGDAKSIAGIARANQQSGWREIAPDEHHDWIGQRDAVFQKLYPMGTTEAKAGDADDNVIFKYYSNGYYTGKDPYLYNFSRRALATNVREMIADYTAALDDLRQRGGGRRDHVDEMCRAHSASIRWDATLKGKLKARREAHYTATHLRKTLYRTIRVDELLCPIRCSQSGLAPARLMFPASEENRAICIPAVGSTKPFSALVVDRMPDVQLASNGQMLPPLALRAAGHSPARPAYRPPRPRQDRQHP